MLYTTLSDIRRHRPCEDGWRKLLSHLGKTAADDEPLSFATILESNGLDDALWCLRALPEEWRGACRHLACDFAETALVYVPEGETRPAEAIRVARLFADGLATEEELDAAWAAAWAAARDAQKTVFMAWLEKHDNVVSATSEPVQ